MKLLTLWRGGVACALIAAFGLLAAGCSNSGSPSNRGKDAGAKSRRADADTATAGAKEIDHSGWWCDEHGLPEEVCDVCNAKYRAAEKAKGNWCEHGRVKTSCFKCNPGLKEKYAAMYEAKYGKKPPEPEPDEDDLKEKLKDLKAKS
jgi:hypothetical protein